MYRAPVVPVSAPLLVAVVGGQVLGIALDSGQVMWQYAMKNPHTCPRLHVTENHVFVAGSMIACLDYLTGAVYWAIEAPNTHVHAGTMLVQDGRLLITIDDQLICYSITDGSFLWGGELPAKGWDAIALGVPGNIVQADGR
jgi:outer membrane protein assembly factor BamB